MGGVHRGAVESLEEAYREQRAPRLFRPPRSLRRVHLALRA